MEQLQEIGTIEQVPDMILDVSILDDAWARFKRERIIDQKREQRRATGEELAFRRSILFALDAALRIKSARLRMAGEACIASDAIERGRIIKEVANDLEQGIIG